MTHFANDTVECVSLGRRFESVGLSQLVLDNYRSKHLRSTYHIEFKDGEVWIFEYGIIVCWGISEDTKHALIKRLEPYIEDATPEREHERFSFSVDDNTANMHLDHISLANANSLDRLAVSHALAQSIKLTEFEETAQRVIRKYNEIPATLARTGRIPLSRKQLAKLRGELFGTKSDILLNFGLLDTPEFFWDYPEVEPLYLMIARYLDITSRMNVLNKKMETIHEFVEMLASEQNHKHSSFLEWIIIILIAVEIVLFFWH